MVRLYRRQRFHNPILEELLLGTLVLAALAILNWIGLKTGSRAQEITSLVKALSLTALVIAAFTISVKAGTATFSFAVGRLVTAFAPLD